MIDATQRKAGPHSAEPPFPSEKGFTLIEVVAGLVLLSVLVAVFGLGLTTAIEGYSFARSNVQVTQKGQMAMTRIARELGELTDIIVVTEGAGTDPSIIYERLVPSTVPPRVRFGLRLDTDAQTILYYSDLQDDLAFAETPGHILADGVDGFEVILFDGDTEMTWDNSSDIRDLDTIQISLRLIRPDNPDHDQSFITRVHVRNAGR